MDRLIYLSFRGINPCAEFLQHSIADLTKVASMKLIFITGRPQDFQVFLADEVLG